MAELDEEIREIKREIVESRGLVIKTSNLLNAHAADLKAIAKRQAGYEQRFAWNSWVAYILFAALSFIGLKLASDARVREMEGVLAERTRERDTAATELREARTRAETRTRAEHSAEAFYQLIREHKHPQIVEQYATVRTQNLSPTEATFFRDAAANAQDLLAREYYQTGLELGRTGRYAEAAESFQDSLRLDETSPRSVAAKLELARVLLRLNQHARAKLLAAEVAEQSLDRELQDDALLIFADAAEALSNLDEAQGALRAYLRRWTHGQYATDVRRHLADVTRRIQRGTG